MSRHINFYKAISDRTRRDILRLLKQSEMNVTEIGEHFDLSQPTLSHHLAVLKNAGIVETRKVGREVFYSLNQCCVAECCCELLGMFGLSGGQLPINPEPSK